MSNTSSEGGGGDGVGDDLLHPRRGLIVPGTLGRLVGAPVTPLCDGVGGGRAA